MGTVVKFKEQNGTEVTDHGIVFPENISEQEFFDTGRKLSNMEKGLQWAIGDWYLAIPWGDKQAACKEAGLNYKTAQKCGQVCGSFQMPHRCGISFKHHFMLSVGDLSKDQKNGLLLEAETSGWSSKKLADERDKVLGKYVEPVEAPTDVDGVIESALVGVPVKYQNKVKSVVSTVQKKMVSDFKSAVTLQSKKIVDVEQDRLKEYRKELEERDEALTKAFKKVNHILTLAEFKLIRSLLHPDKHDPKDKARYEKAFNAFQKLLDNVDPQARKRWES